MKVKKDVEKKLEKIAKLAIDKHLIGSWYYNGDKFVVIFKRLDNVCNKV